MPILAAVDGDHEEDPVVSTGYDLAEAYGDQLVVLHVMTNEEFADRQEANREYFLENAGDTARGVARRVTRGTLGGVGDIEFSGGVGPVAETVLALAREHEARYLVVGGRERSPVGKALFGSTTQTLLMDAERPVVSVTRGEREED